MNSFGVPTFLLICSAILAGLFVYVWRLEKRAILLSKIRNLESTLPAGTKFYYDAWSGRKCLRCTKGKIALRERYQTSLKENGKLVLSALPRVHWCDTCSYRNTSLEIEEETNLK